MANKGGFSWKRATGVTKAKQKISRTTGIPMTKSGRQRKVGKAVVGGGCLIPVISVAAVLIMSVSAFAHPGRTDANGGHTINADGWGYAVGTYHYHDRYGNIIPADKESGKVTAISVVVNGKKIQSDVDPVIIDGRTLLPLRAVAEALGCGVEWDNDTRTAYLSTPDYQSTEKVTFEGDGIKVALNNELVSFDVEPTILNERTVVPIRPVAEKLGCTVEWDGTYQIVYIERAE